VAGEYAIMPREMPSFLIYRLCFDANDLTGPAEGVVGDAMHLGIIKERPGMSRGA
jgi:hypothetical protein